MSLEQPSASSPIPLNDAPKPDCDFDAASNGVSSPQNEEPPPPVPAPTPPLSRSNRPSRACTLRAAERLQAAQQQAAGERKQKLKKDQQQQQQQGRDESPEKREQCSGNSKIVTPLIGSPEPAQLPRWSLRSMWELASILNFLHVFRPLLNIQVEFSVEEFETALLTPNDTLGEIHMPILKAIPPITRMALTRDTWITVLCRKLRDWWHWVADGDLPIVASHGVEIEVYKNLDPGIRVVILKVLCDIRVEQEDIRNYIDNSLKHGVQLSSFRKERVGGDSQGINYWYEDDPIIGHRLYREIRKVEVKKAKTRGSQVISNTTYQWETVATNFEEFQDVSEKLFASKNRTEASLGKKLQNDMLPEIEKVHKRKEKLLKKQHRQALLLDSFLAVDGLGPGRALRDRKPVTYTFDDYDKSINEAIKITKQKLPSPEPNNRRGGSIKPEPETNGKWAGPSHPSPPGNFSMPSPDSLGYDDIDEEKEEKQDLVDQRQDEILSNRRRQRPQRYSAGEFVEQVSDNDDPDFDSDDDIVGEAVYDEEYLKKRKQRRKLSSSSEGEEEPEGDGDEEYRWDEENGEDEEEEEEEEDDDSLSISDESDEPRKLKKLPGRTRRGTKIRSVGEIQSGLRRSRRATRNQINYRQYEVSESETESAKPEKSFEPSDSSENPEYSAGSRDSADREDEEQDMNVDQPIKDEQTQPPDNSSSPGLDEVDKSKGPGENEIDGASKRSFLDLNELAPGSGFDDNRDNF